MHSSVHDVSKPSTKVKVTMVHPNKPYRIARQEEEINPSGDKTMLGQEKNCQVSARASPGYLTDAMTSPPKRSVA